MYRYLSDKWCGKGSKQAVQAYPGVHTEFKRQSCLTAKLSVLKRDRTANTPKEYIHTTANEPCGKHIKNTEFSAVITPKH